MTDEEEEAWIERRQTHDALLRKDLGKPDKFTETSEPNTFGLDKAPNCHRFWGEVVSNFDCGGDAYISITDNSDKAL